MISHLKRRIGVLSAIAVMAALVPAMASSPVSAAPLAVAAAPASSSTYSACPGSANIPSAGFTDTTSTDVDCIAYYGITTGVTATTYEPSANIPRWQMALYLTRTADKAGHTLGSGADQGFTDISGYSAAIQTAINQLKQLGVTTGTTATTYDPDSNVTREQMSMFVERLLGKTAVGPNGAAVSSPDTLTTNISLVGSDADAYNYTDIDGSITFEGHNAIEELYNLGVYGHTKAITTFSPAADITRADMATWLTNALGHTNLRPAGVNIQLSKNSGFGNTSPTASATYRDSNHKPVSGQVIDMFSWQNSTATGNTSPWSSTGTCNLNTNVSIVGNSLTKCTIDVGDPSTDANGNIAVGTITQTATKTLSVYAWTGTAATKYDNDVHAADASQVDGTTTALPTIITISCDVNSKATESGDQTGFLDPVFVKHGTTVTISLQMAAAANGGVYASVPLPGNSITVTHKIGTAGGTTEVASQTSTTVVTDANGAASYSFTQTDPNVGGASVNDTTDDVYHNIVITDLASQDATTGAQTETVPASVASADGKPCWQDSQAAGMSFDFMDTVSTTSSAVTDQVTTNVASYKAGTATAPIARTSTSTLRDKFGDVVANAAGAAVWSGGVGDALDATAVAGAGSNTADAFYTAENMSLRMPVGTPVCFTSLTGGNLAVDDGTGALAVGTVYYVKTITNLNPSEVTIARTSGGATISLTGTPATTNFINVAHPTLGCASRTYGPAGTASVAWNDTATTSVKDQVHVRTSVGESAAGEAGTTSIRHIAASSTALGTGFDDTLVWSEVNTQGTGADETADIIGTPIIVDTVGNTILAKISYGQGGTDRFVENIAAASNVIEVDLLAHNGTFLTVFGGLNSPICMGTPAGFETTTLTAGTVYYIKTIADGTASGADTKISVSATRPLGVAAGAATIAGTPSGTDTYVYPAVTTINGGAYGDSCGYDTYVQYSYDANDHYYINDGATASSEAGFEGSYVANATAGTKGLLNHFADGSGVAYAAGDLYGVTYEALAGNTSVFKLGD